MYTKNNDQNQSLKDLNTFRIDVTAKKVIFVQTITTLVNIWKKCKRSHTPFIILGEGSNILFLENYTGVIVINRIKGISITEKRNSWLLHVNSGEKWHDLVKYTLKIGLFGLENLACIPGCIGSAVIQNIGAYGLEIEKICHYVDIISLHNSSIKRIYSKKCAFSYRDSIFKHQYYGCLIISVGIKLSKIWRPVIFYSLLKKIQITQLTPYNIFHLICNIRKKKLPDPKKIGNAGSFFKNPIIPLVQAKKLKNTYINIPCYLQKNGLIKISAAWLINNYSCIHMKIGDAALHKKQPLILINKKNASAQHIVKLAKKIQKCIMKKFNIWLEPEIDFFDAIGEKKTFDNIYF